MTAPSPASLSISAGLAPAAFDATRVPFVIGITGNRNLAGYRDDDSDEDGNGYQSHEMKELRRRLFAVFDWVRGYGAQPGKGCLDPTSGEWHPDWDCPDDATAGGASCWKPLNLRQMPILVLSSLAPGADTIVVESALAYVKERSDKGIFVRGPLPFPVDIYRTASTFITQEEKERQRSALPLTEKQKRFNRLLTRLKAQESFEEHRDLFVVELDKDLRGNDPEGDLTRDDDDFKKPRRHLRYRAAGEYVATQSHLLLAIHDREADKANPDDLFCCGTATIVETKRRGRSHELLAMPNSYVWADNGPVLVLPCRCQADAPPAAALPARDQADAPPALAFLHPYDLLDPDDLQPQEGPPPDDDPKWQREGNRRFRRVLARQEAFNCLLPTAREEKGELAAMVGEDILGAGKAGPFAERFDALAQVRRRAASEARRLDGQRWTLLICLLVFISVAAMCLSTFEHWYNPRALVDVPPGQDLTAAWIAEDAGSWIQCFLLLLSLGSLLLSGLVYYRYLKADTESRRYDYRALGEALRVQFYWLLMGMGRSVPAAYMQRHRDEFDWIRRAVSSLSLPFETSRQDFLTTLDHGDQHRLFDAAHCRWVVKQKDWFRKEARRNSDSARLFRALGWGLAAVGLVSIIAMLAVELSPRLEHGLREYYHWAGWTALGIGCVLFALDYLARRPGDRVRADSSHGKAARGSFLRWLFGNRAMWSGAIIGSSATVLAAFFLGKLTPVWPDEHNWWCIFTSAWLLGAGLCVAWAERNFFSEQARIYRSMMSLYTCADRRLEPLLRRFQSAKAGSPEADRLRTEIQNIFYQLGCEALDENAGWLVQHRARPLEPFMVG